nr:P44/Msp2 family outer membrane protein [Anaplasma marginale]
MLTALEGSIGYSIGGARVEVEVGYERFVIKGGKKSNEDTASVFLLGKELAYDTARGQVDRLAAALGKMTKSEAKKWGNAIESATGTTNGEKVSQKVCGNGTGSSGTQCGKNSGDTNGSSTTQHKISAVFTDEATLLSAAGDTINTTGMAGNINSLTKDEKAIVAGAFARAVEGAEVIEVRAIGSTSVMLNPGITTLPTQPKLLVPPLHLAVPNADTPAISKNLSFGIITVLPRNITHTSNLLPRSPST